MVKNQNIIISKTGFILICILLFSLFPKAAIGSHNVDIPKIKSTSKQIVSDLINFQPSEYQDQIKRYIIFGPGSVMDIISRANHVTYGMNSNHGSLVMDFLIKMRSQI